jgi:hypothetical protein
MHTQKCITKYDYCDLNQKEKFISYTFYLLQHYSCDRIFMSRLLVVIIWMNLASAHV